MSSRLGTWFRCKDNNNQTICDWLAAIECSGIVKKPEAMHVDLFNCETTQAFHAMQTHMQIQRDADDSLPSLHQSKRRRCVADGTSPELSMPSPDAPPTDEMTDVLSATSEISKASRLGRTNHPYNLRNAHERSDHESSLDRYNSQWHQNLGDQKSDHQDKRTHFFSYDKTIRTDRRRGSCQ